ncbi:MAG: HPr family phosphocarrier protein [Alphaproteobacteria bacterium]
MSGSLTIERTVTISHPVGLHARPAIAFTKLAKGFKAADIRIRGGDDRPWVDAKSIVKVMALKLRTGAVLQMQASGAEAEAAIDALQALVERDFDEVSGTGAASEAHGADKDG